MLRYRYFSPVLFWLFWRLKWQKKLMLAKKCQHDTMILHFTLAILSAFSMPTWVRRTAILHLFMNALLQLIENVKKWGFIFGHVHYLHQEKKKSQILGPNSKSFQSYGNYKIGLKFQHFTLCHFGFHNCVEYVISPK